MTNSKPIIVGAAGIELSADESALFAHERPAGLILFQRNCETPEQLSQLIADFRASVDNPDALVFIDQEGGRVARLRPPHWRSMPPSRVFGQMAEDDFVEAAAALELATVITASELHRLGITVNCAPVLDVPVEGAHDVIGDRAFSSDPSLVARLGRIAVDAMIKAGVLPVIKHVPGHGRAQVDSHHALPRVDADRGLLCDTDFIPFKALTDAPMAMTAHIVYEGIDDEQPLTLSKKGIENVVRGDIGFEGLLLSDDIGMKALSGTLAERALGALGAGCDLVLECSGVLADARTVLEAVEPMDDDVRERIAHNLTLISDPEPVDLDNASARLSQLIGSQG